MSIFFPAQKPKVSENDFEDLLPNQGFSKSDKKGPKTMAEMRKQELARDTDPFKLKVGTPRAQTTLWRPMSPARDLDLAPGGPWGRAELGPPCSHTARQYDSECLHLSAAHGHWTAMRDTGTTQGSWYSGHA